MHRYRQVSTSYMWGERYGKGQDRCRGLKVQATNYKIKKI